MKILNIFITHDLNLPFQIKLFDNNECIEELSIYAKDINDISVEFDQIEVILSAECASIFNVELPEQLSDRKITDSYLLTLLEDQLLDDIDNLVPIMMRIDTTAYVAILDKEFHAKILHMFSQFDKPIRYIQLHPLLTEYHEDAITVFCSENINFIRNSSFEYYMFDPNNFGIMFDAFLLPTHKRVIYYGHNQIVEDHIRSHQILIEPQQNINTKTIVWNLRFNKSSKLSRNFWKGIYNTLYALRLQLSIVAITGALFLAISLGINIATDMSYQKTIAKNMKTLGVTEYNSFNIISKSNLSLNKMSHDDGLNDISDFMSLFQDFLQVANVQSTTINSVEYKNSTLKVFLNSEFNNTNFSTYRATWSTFGLFADMVSFGEYTNQNTKKNKGILDSSNNSDFTYRNDSAWVVTMHY